MAKKKYAKLFSLAAVALLLTSCNEIVNLPSNKGDQIVDVGDVENNKDIYFNDLETVYDNIQKSNSIYQKQLDNLLYDLAKEELKDNYAFKEGEVIEKANKELFKTVIGSTYSTNNEFNEYRYGVSLRSSLYDIKTKDGQAISSSNGYKGYVNPNDRIDDTHTINYTNAINKYLKYDYSDYQNKISIPDIYRQGLTAKYIYDNSYSSIGNTNARNVVVVKLKDSEEHPGSASSFINKFFNEYLDEQAPSLAKNYDIYDLARMYKGVDISTEEADWITSNNLFTMADKIDEDYKKVKDNLTNPQSKYADLESSFTNNYTYTIEHGYELKKSALLVNDIVTDGLYLKTNGLSELPDTVKNRVFSTDIPTTLFPTEDNDSSSKTYSNTNFKYLNGRWYVKPVTSEASNKSSSIVTFDSSSSTYYLVEIKDFVSSYALAKRDSDSQEEKNRKMDLALDVAYEMASADNYKKDAIVHYLRNSNIVFSDPDFYDYIKNNYPKVFEDEE